MGNKSHITRAGRRKAFLHRYCDAILEVLKADSPSWLQLGRTDISFLGQDKKTFPAKLWKLARGDDVDLPEWADEIQYLAYCGDRGQLSRPWQKSPLGHGVVLAVEGLTGIQEPPPYHTNGGVLFEGVLFPSGFDMVDLWVQEFAQWFGNDFARFRGIRECRHVRCKLQTDFANNKEEFRAALDGWRIDEEERFLQRGDFIIGAQAAPAESPKAEAAGTQTDAPGLAGGTQAAPGKPSWDAPGLPDSLRELAAFFDKHGKPAEGGKIIEKGTVKTSLGRYASEIMKDAKSRTDKDWIAKFIWFPRGKKGRTIGLRTVALNAQTYHKLSTK